METASEFVDEAACTGTAPQGHLMVRMGHEIRNPLNAILGFAQVMATDSRHPLTELQRARVSEIMDIAQHMCAVIDDVAVTARVGNLPSVNPTSVAVALTPVIADVARWMTPRAQAFGVSLASQSCPAHALAHAPSLRQLLINLVCHAIDRCAPGGRARIRVDTVGGEVHLSVCHTAGLPRAHPSEPNALASARRLVEAMGARLEARGPAGTGCQYTVVLSATDPAPAN